MTKSFSFCSATQFQKKITILSLADYQSENMTDLKQVSKFWERSSNKKAKKRKIKNKK
jgi:hypothetical protein